MPSAALLKNLRCIVLQGSTHCYVAYSVQKHHFIS